MQQLLTGNDGAVRAAMIKVVDCEGRPSLLRRRIQHLIPIEVGTNETGMIQQEQPQEVIETPTTTVHDNPKGLVRLQSQAIVISQKEYPVDLADMLQWLEKSTDN